MSRARPGPRLHHRLLVVRRHPRLRRDRRRDAVPQRAADPASRPGPRYRDTHRRRPRPCSPDRPSLNGAHPTRWWDRPADPEPARPPGAPTRLPAAGPRPNRGHRWSGGSHPPTALLPPVASVCRSAAARPRVADGGQPAGRDQLEEHLA